MTALPGWGCVVLAAGGSKRLGEPKQLLRFSGETLIGRTARLALEAGFSPVCVVLGSRVEEVRPALAGCSVLIVENAEWELGMSTSLRAGIQHVIADSPLSHLLVMVCDQTQLSAAVLAALIAASVLSPERVVASSYNGQLGVPAIFPSAFFLQLQQVEGDRGARVVLEALRREVVAVEFSGGGEDIDTAEDARRAGLL